MHGHNLSAPLEMKISFSESQETWLALIQAFFYITAVKRCGIQLLVFSAGTSLGQNSGEEFIKYSILKLLIMHIIGVCRNLKYFLLWLFNKYP